MDVAVLIDVSQSMKESDRKQLNGIFDKIVDKLGVSPKGSHMAIITFGSDAKLIFTLAEKKYHNAETLKEKAKEAILFPPPKEGTRTDLAVDLAVKNVFTKGGDRAKFRNVMIIFTDGKFWIDLKWDDRPEIDFDNRTKTLEVRKNQKFDLVFVKVFLLEMQISALFCIHLSHGQRRFKIKFGLSLILKHSSWFTFLNLYQLLE